jgi:hypothetical protein
MKCDCRPKQRPTKSPRSPKYRKEDGGEQVVDEEPPSGCTLPAYGLRLGPAGERERD